MLKLGDGKCIIELMSTEAGGSDFWSPGDFKGVAYRLIRKCVVPGDEEGGSAFRLGQSRSCQNERFDVRHLTDSMQAGEEAYRCLFCSGNHTRNVPIQREPHRYCLHAIVF